jgi:hypothetical protein
MTTQPFLVAPFKYGPLLGNEQPPFRVRKIKHITDLVGFQIHPVYLVGELPSQAQSHLGGNYRKARTPVQDQAVMTPQPGRSSWACEVNLTRILGPAYTCAGSLTFG